MTPFVHYSACMEAYDHVFGKVLTQQILGILEHIPSLRTSIQFQPPQDLLQRICTELKLFLKCVFVRLEVLSLPPCRGYIGRPPSQLVGGGSEVLTEDSRPTY